MTLPTREDRRHLETLEGAELERHQLDRLNRLLEQIVPANKLYGPKLAGVPRPIESFEALAEIPYTYKEELQAHHPDGPHSVNLTFPPEKYVRFHQTSGTRGRPLVVLDTAEDWRWWLGTWQYVLDAAGITERDRIMMAFSFGPFIGFWSAHDAAIARGAMVVPGGGMSTLGRLEMMRNAKTTAIFCTPSYALHMAEVARQHQIKVAELPVERIVLAGEPGGSVPAVRTRIQQAWDAEVFDHAGASEVGPWGYNNSLQTGLHVNEAEFIAEFLSVESGGPASEGELAELVLTNLGRPGFPVLRYRTGDLVRPSWQHEEACRFVLLEGGALGRTDDMLVIRGVNIYPSAIEQILLGFPEIHEYRMTATRQAEMDQLTIEIEDQLQQPQRVSEELEMRLSLRVDVQCVPLGTLPRFEAKGKRFVDRRSEAKP